MPWARSAPMSPGRQPAWCSATTTSATIVAAVEEGRGTYQNIRRSLQYLLGTNAGEVILMLGAVFLGLPLPLLPLQLLWINLIGDGLPAIALSVSPPSPDVMQQPPHAVPSDSRVPLSTARLA